MNSIWAAVAVLLWVHTAGAQTGSPQTETASAAAPANSDAPATEAASEEKTVAARAAVLAKLLNPKEYGPAFYSGAQGELVVPAVGVSAILFGYDAVWMQSDLSVGLGVGGDPVADVDAEETYVASLRFAFPVHRGVRADYALAVGGGATFVDPTVGNRYVLGTIVGGAKIRVFISPNVAVGATLGVATFIRGENSSLIVGARPLGSASVAYFFR